MQVGPIPCVTLREVAYPWLKDKRERMSEYLRGTNENFHLFLLAKFWMVANDVNTF
jgi:hypothetical protein